MKYIVSIDDQGVCDTKLFATGDVLKSNEVCLNAYDYCFFCNHAHQAVITDGKLAYDMTRATRQRGTPTQSTSYADERRAEYPQIGDQLDAIWKLLSDPTNANGKAIQDKIAEVKAKYPVTSSA